MSFYIAIHFKNVALSHTNSMFHLFGKPIFMALQNCGILAICKQTKTLNYLRTLIVSRNEISSVENNCFKLMKNIHHLNMSLNTIGFIDRNSFLQSKQINILDLSWNSITYLQEKVFSGLISLNVLNLTENPIVSVSSSSFANAHIKIIITKCYKVCCFLPSVQAVCPAKPLWPDSCERLISDDIVKVFSWTIICTAFIMNFCSCLIIRLKLIQSADSMNSVLICLSIIDIIYCISVLMVVITDEIFANDYLEYEHNWRSSFFCYNLSVLSTIANYLSLFTINLLAITRYCVLKNPLDSSFLDSHFLVRICTIAAISITLPALSLYISYFYTAEGHQLPSGLCLMLGRTEKSVMSYLITIFSIVFHITSFVLIPWLYYLILQIMVESKANLGEASALYNSATAAKPSLATFSNLLCLVPSSVLLFITLIWDEYPFVLLIWATLVIIPLVTVINPFVFVIFKWFKVKLSKKSKKWKSSAKRLPREAICRAVPPSAHAALTAPIAPAAPVTPPASVLSPAPIASVPPAAPLTPPTPVLSPAPIAPIASVPPAAPVPQPDYVCPSAPTSATAVTPLGPVTPPVIVITPVTVIPPIPLVTVIPPATVTPSMKVTPPTPESSFTPHRA